MSVTGSSLCHPPTPTLLCPYLHPSTHSSLSLPQPPCVACLSLPSTGSTFSMWQERGRERGKKTKNKSGSNQDLCQAIRLSLSVSWWVSWHVHDHEPTMRRGIASPWCTPLTLRLTCTQAVFAERHRGLWSHPQRQIQNKGVRVFRCCTSHTYTTTTSAHYSALRTKQAWSFIWVHLCSDLPLWVTLNVCLHMYYTLYVGGCDRDVLLEVSGQQESSVCCVFVGIMIDINNLTGLPYCPFILFSSLPLDITICFHFHKWAHCAQKTSESLRRVYIRKKSERYNNNRPTKFAFTYYISARSHVLVCLCPQTLIHTHKEGLLTKWAGSNIVHNIDHIIYSSLSSYKGIDQIIPYAGLGHSQIAKMGLLHLKCVP